MTRLLLIDDDDATREVLTVMLEGEGWQVTSASSGDAALAMAAAVAPEVVLSDLQMPGLSGPALAAELRRAKGASILMLAMTATAGAAIPDGFDALLVKPFPPEAVWKACQGMASPVLLSGGTDAITPSVFDRIKRSMPAAQVKALYNFAIADAEKRMTSMADSIRSGDDSSFRRDAHALKGACGMIGAARLHAAAARAESLGLPAFTESKFADFHRELSVVRRMLVELFPSDR